LLIIYRLENQRSIRSELRARNIKTIVEIFGETARTLSPQQMHELYYHKSSEEKLRAWLRDHPQPSDMVPLADLKYDLKLMNKSVTYAGNLRHRFEQFLGYHLGIISFSILGIYFTPLIRTLAITQEAPSVYFLIYAFLLVLIAILAISWMLTWPLVLFALRGLEEKSGKRS
jgi:hypothetical protein